MVLSLKDLLSHFKIKRPPEKDLSEAVISFFKDKNITLSGSVAVFFKDKAVKITGDPYVISYVKINKMEMLAYLRNKFPLLNIEEIN
jgi:hypothetical protein